MIEGAHVIAVQDCFHGAPEVSAATLTEIFCFVAVVTSGGQPPLQREPEPSANDNQVDAMLARN